MNEQHIIEILDATPLAALSEGELSAIGEHTARCGECRQAFQAAKASAAVLKFEAEQILEPAPFFQTKVMAALRGMREQRNNLKPVWDFWRIWQASRSLVSLMVVIVAGLIFAVELAPSTRDTQPLAAADSTEVVIFEPDNALGDMTSEQIFQEIYER